MLAVLLRSTYFFDPVFRHVPAVLTIHNAGYQGWFPPQTMEKLLLPWDMFTFDKLEHYDTMNFLKGGIVYADAITTVSRKYAEEIQTAEFGNGLEDILRQAERRSLRHPQRRRLYRVESSHRPTHRRALFRRKSCGQERVQARPAARLRI